MHGIVKHINRNTDDDDDDATNDSSKISRIVLFGRRAEKTNPHQKLGLSMEL